MPLLARLCVCLFVTVAVGIAHAAELTGERRCWHKLTLSLKGPQAVETDTAPNPFLDYRMTVTFTHPASGKAFAVPGYFAADGDAGESSAASGDVWRAHFAPHKPGWWEYRVSFVSGEHVAIEADAPGETVAGADAISGGFTVEPTDKTGRDFRGKGRLQRVGDRYLRHAETGGVFLKAGPDAPETLLAYQDFDGTVAHKNKVKLKSWAPHVQDWNQGDPTWKDGKGKGLIGAMNYLASEGLNVVSFLPYNAGGDGDNVWPMIARDKPLHYDCSKLDQWQIVFDHAQQNGLFLHFKLQETENDDNTIGKDKTKEVPTALDGGELGVERKLYLRELVARFGYALAINWNLGEENTQTTAQQADMARYLRSIDPYDHLVVIHSYPNQQNKVYEPHLGDATTLTGVSLQNNWNDAHRQTKRWVTASAAAGHPWVCSNDEQGPADAGVPPNADYQATPGRESRTNPGYTQDDIRKQTLWGTLMAGGTGVEYYFGYKLAESDLLCEDFRSRSGAWRDCRTALEFFAANPLPLPQTLPADELVTVTGAKPVGKKQGKPVPESYCLAQPGELYLVYLLNGGTATLDLTDVTGSFIIEWFNPRDGGNLQAGPIARVTGGAPATLGSAPTQDDWLVLVRKQ